MSQRDAYRPNAVIPVYAATTGSVSSMKLREAELVERGYQRVHAASNALLGPRQYSVREAPAKELFRKGRLRMSIVWREDP
jgi:hypothetical protein